MESNFPHSAGFKCRDAVSQSVMQRKLKKRKEEAKSISQRREMTGSTSINSKI